VTEPLSLDTAFQIHTEKIFDLSHRLPRPGLHGRAPGQQGRRSGAEGRRNLADEFADGEG
jgi:hypothetical protein